METTHTRIKSHRYGDRDSSACSLQENADQEVISNDRGENRGLIQEDTVRRCWIRAVAMEGMLTMERGEQEHRGYLRECFALADAENRGYLRWKELKCAVAAALGIRPSKLVLAQLFEKQITMSESDLKQLKVDRETFVATLMPRMRKADLLDDVRRSFKAFDLRSEGFISFQSFQRACASVFPHLSSETQFRMFQAADRDRDGRVTYHDFETMYLVAMQLQAQEPRHASRMP